MAQYSYMPNDLDLFEVESMQDPKEIVDTFGGLIEADSDFKIYAARTWLENFLYFSGLRDSTPKFQSSTITGNSLITPLMNNRPGQVMNRRRISKTFKAVQIQASNITRQNPSVKVWPDSDGDRSNTKAKLSNIVLDYLWQADGEDDIQYEALLWALLTPAVARKDYLDFSFNKSRIWPIFERDERGNVQMLPTGQPVIKTDQNGNPMLTQLPSNKTELVPAFRLIFNPSASWKYNVDYVGDVSIKRLQWVHQNYNRNDPGYHPENLADVKKGAWKFTAIMAMENAIKQLSFGAFRRWNYSASGMKDGVVFANFFIQPSPSYPKGREIAIGNGVLLYDGDSRSYRENPNVWHPHNFLCYERVPGRLWGTTYAEKITDINRAYEQARTEFDQLRRTFSKPKMMIPQGAQIERDTITGEEQVFRYNPFGADGGKASYLNPPNPPATVIEDIKMTAGEFVEMSGVTEIMQGIRPQGVTTYRGLEVLREEASNASNNLIRMYERFITGGQCNKLENFRQGLVYPDKVFVNAIKIFKKMRQYVTDIDIKNFVGDDLGGHVTVEPFSTVGKSRLALQEKYMSLAQMGVLGDVVQDPDLNTEFKRKMDVSGFDPPQNKQVIYARYENDLMLTAQEKGQVINPKVETWHDDQLHIREVEMLLLDPALQDKPLIMQSLMAHREVHLKQLSLKQATAPQPPPAKDEGGGKAKKGGNVVAAQGQGGVLFGPENGFASNPTDQMA